MFGVKEADALIEPRHCDSRTQEIPHERHSTIRMRRRRLGQQNTNRTVRIVNLLSKT